MKVLETRSNVIVNYLAEAASKIVWPQNHPGEEGVLLEAAKFDLLWSNFESCSYRPGVPEELSSSGRNELMNRLFALTLWTDQ